MPPLDYIYLPLTWHVVQASELPHYSIYQHGEPHNLETVEREDRFPQPKDPT